MKQDNEDVSFFRPLCCFCPYLLVGQYHQAILNRETDEMANPCEDAPRIEQKTINTKL